MRNLAYLLIIVAFWSCRANSDAPDQSEPISTVPDTAAKSSKMKLGFSDAVRIDTSSYVMYKMALSVNEKETKDKEDYRSKSEDTRYWNITFYNTATGEHHLLATNKKMIVDTWDIRNDENQDADKHAKSDTLLFYNVTMCDYNKDHKLDGTDPTYLFISNKTGYNFKQISPDSAHVKNWHFIRSSGKILMETAEDTNRNGDYDDEEIIPYIYDLHTGGPVKRVFTDGFKLSVKQLKNELWPVKSSDKHL